VVVFKEMNLLKFKKMNTANSPPWRGLGVGQHKNIIYFFEVADDEN